MASLTTNITTESQTTQENNYPIHLFLVRHGDRQDYDPIRGPIWKKQAEQSILSIDKIIFSLKKTVLKSS